MDLEFDTSDGSLANAPAGLQTALSYVQQVFDQLFTAPVTVTVAVQWGGLSNPDALAQSQQAENDYNGPAIVGDVPAYKFNQPIIQALQANGAFSIGQTDIAALGGGPPYIWTSEAEDKALGIGGGSGDDGTMTLGSGVAWYWNPATPDVAIPSNETYAVGVIEHEVSEIMGRVIEGSQEGAFTPLDFYRYTSVGGAPDVVAGSNPTAIFSLDGGKTALATWNDSGVDGNGNPYDFADFLDGSGGVSPDGVDPFGTGDPGAVEPLNFVDIKEMNALGWATSFDTSSDHILNGIAYYLTSGFHDVDRIVDSGAYLQVDRSASAGNMTVFAGGHMLVNYGGVATNTAVAGTFIDYGEADGTYIASGATFSVFGAAEQTYVSGGATLSDFGATYGTDIQGGGSETVSSGGSATGSKVENGAFQYVDLGGVAVGTVVSSGGEQDVYLAAHTSYGSVLAGGLQVIKAHGQSANDAIYGAQTLYGSSTSATVFDGGVQDVDAIPNFGSNGAATATDVMSGGEQDVASGGSATSGTISAGGVEHVHGTDSGTTVYGEQDIFNGGSGTSETIGGETIAPVGSGGVQYVDSGGNTTGVTVAKYGEQDVLAFGSAAGTMLTSGVQEVTGTASGTVLSGGLEEVYGTDTGSVDHWGVIEVYNGGASISATLVGDGPAALWAIMQVDSGGTESAAYVEGNSGEIVYGSSIAADVQTGALDSHGNITSGQEIGSGGVASATTIGGSGVEAIDSGGRSLAAIIKGNGEQVVESGGSASGATVEDDGAQLIYSGGSATGTNLYDFGQLVVSSGGSASYSTVSGPDAAIYVHGFESGATVDQGIVIVDFGGVTSGDNIYTSGNGAILDGETVLAGGKAYYATVDSGGLLDISGIASGTTISGDGSGIVEFGGEADATKIVGGVATLIVKYGGVASGTIVNSAQGVENVFGSSTNAAVLLGAQTVESSGVAIGTLIDLGEQDVLGSSINAEVESGGVEIVLSGGTAHGTRIDEFGSQSVFGTDSGAIVGGLGIQTVHSGGSSTAASVSGSQDVFGVATSATIYFGGGQIVESGAATTGTFVDGGEQDVYGKATGSIVNSGGLVHVYGEAQDLQIGSAGSAVLESIGTLVDAVTFAGSGGYLQIDGPSTGAAIQHFDVGDTIDFPNVAYHDGWTVSPLPGSVERFSIGGSAIALQFDPHESFVGKSFELSKDSGGGVQIALAIAPLSMPAVISTGQYDDGVQIVAGGYLTVAGSTTGTTVSSGGAEEVLSGGSDSGSTVDDGGHQYVDSGGVASNSQLNDPGIQVVSAGGKAIDATISGGEQDVYGSAIGTFITDGKQIVEAGGHASQTVTSAGGIAPGGVQSAIVDVFGEVDSATLGGIYTGGWYNQIEVESGGLVSGTTLLDWGQETVSSGGVASGAIISVGGQVDVMSGGTEYGTLVNGGYDFNYGSAFNVTVNDGGTLGADLASFHTVVNSGSYEIVYGVASGSTIYGGGTQDVYNSAVSTRLAGGTQYLFDGSAADTIIDSGGVQDVAANYGHASATDTTINSGGSQVVFGGGSASGSVIHGGGSETVSSGGVASDTVVYAGGRLEVQSGGEDDGSMLSGGTETVDSGGVASGATVDAGGPLIVERGGRIAQTTTIDNGLVVLRAGALASDPIVFGAGYTSGTLEMTSAVSSLITGFATGDEIVVAAFSAGDTYYVNGQTLTIRSADGSQSQGLTFDSNTSVGAIQMVVAGGVDTITIETETTTTHVDKSRTFKVAGVAGQPYSGFTIDYDASGQKTGETWTGFSGEPYTSETVGYDSSGRQTSESWSTGESETWSYNGDGSYSTTDTGFGGQPYTSVSIGYNSSGQKVSETWSGYTGYYTGTSISFDTSGHKASQTWSGISSGPYTSFTVDYNASGQQTSETWSNASGLYLTETWNADGSVHDVHHYQVTGQSFTDYDDVFANGRVVTETRSNGVTESWTYNADGSWDVQMSGLSGYYTGFTIDYGATGEKLGETWTGFTGEPYTSITVTYDASGRTVSESWSTGDSQTWAFNADGSYATTEYGAPGTGYVDYTKAYTSANALIASQIDYASGSGSLNLYAGNLTVTSSATAETVLSGSDTFALPAVHARETINALGQSNETFALQAGAGAITLQGFAASDTLQFSNVVFADFGHLMAATHQAGADTVITESATDTLTLANFAMANLTAGQVKFA